MKIEDVKMYRHIETCRHVRFMVSQTSLRHHKLYSWNIKMCLAWYIKEKKKKLWGGKKQRRACICSMCQNKRRAGCPEQHFGFWQGSAMSDLRPCCNLLYAKMHVQERAMGHKAAAQICASASVCPMVGKNALVFKALDFDSGRCL